MAEDAAEYVESVMVTNKMTDVTDTTAKTRKRQFSGEDSCEDHNKKVKTTEGRVAEVESVIDHEMIDTKLLLLQLSKDVRSMSEKINSRIDSLEQKVAGSEKRITEQVIDKITKVFDRRISSEVSRMKNELNKDMDNRIGDLKLELTSDIENINQKIEEMASVSHPGDKKDISKNIVVRNLPFNLSEDIRKRVVDMTRNGLELPEITFVSVERKNSPSDNIPGVVICECKSLEDKSKIMAAKKKLSNTLFYKNVYIHGDQTKEERQHASNMRLLVNAINRGHSNLRVKGTRVMGATKNVAGNQRSTSADGFHGNNDNSGRNNNQNGSYSNARNSSNYRSNENRRESANGGDAWSGAQGRGNSGRGRGNGGGGGQKRGQRRGRY